MLNPHQLNVFTVAAETLNFTETAKRLHLTQSSVSQTIKALETQLDTTLFARKGRRIELTDAGRVLFPLARDIIKESLKVLETMELLKEEVHGHLIVGCNTAPGKYILPSLLADFHKQFPKVKITCQVLPQNQSVERLSEGAVHFALTNLERDQHQVAEFVNYVHEPIALIAPITHRWRGRENIDPAELYEEQFIMREPASGTYISAQAALASIGVDITHLNTFLEMGNSEAIALAVREGLGVGFVSELIIKKICRQDVIRVSIDGMNAFQDIYFGRQTRHPPTAAQAAFWEFIVNTDPSSFI